MSNFCSSCKKLLSNATVKRTCPACEKAVCSNCLYQRVAVPQLKYQMHEVCNPCYHRISNEMILSKPPKGFMQRLEQNPLPSASDPETRALEDRLEQLRKDFPSSSAVESMPMGRQAATADDILQQLNAELIISGNEDKALAARLRVLHETMPAATPDTVVLPKSKEEEEKKKDENDEDDELPWCTVCNDNARQRCLDCDELFCEACARKIHRQSNYKKHQLEAYKPSAKTKKKYDY